MKKIAVFTVILVIMVAIVGNINRFQNRKPAEQSLLFFPGFSEENCSELLFIERTDTAKLKRKGPAWYLVTPCIRAVPAASPVEGAWLPEYPADSAEVRKALVTIKTVKREELISQNPLKQAEFEVDTVTALFLECWDSTGKSLGGIYVGKAGALWDAYYVRAKGSNDVYLAGGSIRFSFFANPKRWTDKSILKFDKNSAQKLKIASVNSGTVELMKTAPFPADTGKKAGWEIVTPVKAKANPERVESLVTSLANLNAVEFEGNTSLSEEAMGFARSPLALTVTLQNGDTKTVFVGKDKVAMKWVRNPEKPNVTFTVYDYTLAGFNPRLAYLKDTSAIDTQSPAEAARLALEKDIKKTFAKKK